MSSAARLRPDPTVMPTRRWERRGCGGGSGNQGRRRRRRGCGQRGRRRSSRPYCPTARSLVLLPALVAGEDAAEREVDRLRRGLCGRHFRRCRLLDPRRVFAQLLGGVSGDLGEDRLPFLNPFEDQRSGAGFGLGSANSLVRVFHGAFLSWWVPVGVRDTAQREISGPRRTEMRPAGSRESVTTFPRSSSASLGLGTRASWPCR